MTCLQRKLDVEETGLKHKEMLGKKRYFLCSWCQQIAVVVTSRSACEALICFMILHYLTYIFRVFPPSPFPSLRSERFADSSCLLLACYCQRWALVTTTGSVSTHPPAPCLLLSVDDRSRSSGSSSHPATPSPGRVAPTSMSIDPLHPSRLHVLLLARKDRVCFAGGKWPQEAKLLSKFPSCVCHHTCAGCHQAPYPARSLSANFLRGFRLSALIL